MRRAGPSWAPEAAQALPARSGGLGGSWCEPNCGHRGLGAQAGPASIVLARMQELFCSLSTGATKSGSRENINTLRISRGMWPIVEEAKMAPLRGLLSAGSEVGLARIHIPAPPLKWISPSLTSPICKVGV